jgi:hypothetical protein
MIEAISFTLELSIIFHDFVVIVLVALGFELKVTGSKHSTARATPLDHIREFLQCNCNKFSDL